MSEPKKVLSYGVAPPRGIPDAVFLAGALVLEWLATTFGTIVFVPAVACAVPLARHRRWGLLGAVILLSPFVASFLIACGQFASGTARLQYMGYPGPEAFNVDPDLRCERSTGGCVVHGGEWMTDEPHNAAIRTLTALFGPQPGAYTGPYPTNTQAAAAIQSATTLKAAQLASDPFSVNGTPVKLASGIGNALLRVTQLDELESSASLFQQELTELGPMSAALWMGRCVVLDIPTGGSAAAPGADGCLVVIDLQKGRPFAHYARGKYHYPIPPATWSR